MLSECVQAALRELSHCLKWRNILWDKCRLEKKGKERKIENIDNIYLCFFSRTMNAAARTKRRKKESGFM